MKKRKTRKTISFRKQRYIVDELGHRIGVLIGVREYENLCSARKALEAIRAHDEAVFLAERHRLEAANAMQTARRRRSMADVMKEMMEGTQVEASEK